MFIHREKAQVSIEYFVLFMAVAVVLLLSITAFYPLIKQMAGGFFQQAIERVLE